MVVKSPHSPENASATTALARRTVAAMAVALLLAVSTAPVIAAADLPGEARGAVAVVFAPGTGEPAIMAAIAAAGGAIVRGGGWKSVLVVQSEESGFARRLRQAGAWLVLDPQSAAGCLIASKKP